WLPSSSIESTPACPESKLEQRSIGRDRAATRSGQALRDASYGPTRTIAGRSRLFSVSAKHLADLFARHLVEIDRPSICSDPGRGLHHLRSHAKDDAASATRRLFRILPVRRNSFPFPDIADVVAEPFHGRGHRSAAGPDDGFLRSCVGVKGV